MEILTKKRPFSARQDFVKRILLKVPRLLGEEAWETKNPGYELHAVKNWQEIAPGTQVWSENENLFSFVSFSLDELSEFQVIEQDGLPAQVRKHWDTKKMRIIVKAD